MMVAPMALPRPEELLAERAAEVNDLVQATAWHTPADLEGRQRLHRTAKHGAALFEQIADLALLGPDETAHGARTA